MIRNPGNPPTSSNADRGCTRTSTDRRRIVRCTRLARRRAELRALLVVAAELVRPALIVRASARDGAATDRVLGLVQRRLLLLVEALDRSVVADDKDRVVARVEVAAAVRQVALFRIARPRALQRLAHAGAGVAARLAQRVALELRHVRRALVLAARPPGPGSALRRRARRA